MQQSPVLKNLRGGSKVGTPGKRPFALGLALIHELTQFLACIPGGRFDDFLALVTKHGKHLSPTSLKLLTSVGMAALWDDSRSILVASVRPSSQTDYVGVFNVLLTFGFMLKREVSKFGGTAPSPFDVPYSSKELDPSDEE
jgi:hypothetical protein